MCQISNLLLWMFLHTPLDRVSTYRYSIALQKAIVKSYISEIFSVTLSSSHLLKEEAENEEVVFFIWFCFHE
ncbi:hypothetical protein DR116_0019480 [Bacillus cereus]|uniref:Uncharacterized protein n=1 Tax=Bacillus cereus TaxID=1396 RepID=A0A9X8IY19_BACCE|nr:hypothetical protein DR116_0019480 [Bacillus cereus]